MRRDVDRIRTRISEFSDSPTSDEEVNGGLGKGNRMPIVFRNSVPEIPRTTYGSFSIYKYPAKFIPQVVAYTLKKYGSTGDVVFDPFAGCGTVGLVARIYGYDYELWDLNPLLSLIHEVSIMPLPQDSVSQLLNRARNSQSEFMPDWSNLDYWFPKAFIPMISRAWGFVHSADDVSKKIISIPLMKTTRYFSNADEKVHKMYKSRFAKAKISRLLASDWEPLFYQKLETEVQSLRTKLKEYSLLKPKPVDSKIRAGINTLLTPLDRDVDIMITSPPYIQAQEYIRSAKMDLYWLGYDETYVKSLSRMELPYGEVATTEVHSATFDKYRMKIDADHLRLLYDKYFHAITASFSTLGERVTKYLCIFVGPAKIRTTRIPIDEILIEHLGKFGWKHHLTYVDPIVSRVMFQSKVNPASGLEDARMPTEHLVILRRR